jgi:hypothetical protein
MSTDKLPVSPFPLNYPESREKYCGEKVAVRINVDGEIKLFLGKFIVHQFEDGGPQYISVHVDGPIFFGDPPPPCGWAFHVSEGHYASIVPARDEKGEIKFAVQEVFQRLPLNRNTVFRPGGP